MFEIPENVLSTAFGLCLVIAGAVLLWVGRRRYGTRAGRSLGHLAGLTLIIVGVAVALAVLAIVMTVLLYFAGGGAPV